MKVLQDRLNEVQLFSFLVRRGMSKNKSKKVAIILANIFRCLTYSDQKGGGF